MQAMQGISRGLTGLSTGPRSPPWRDSLASAAIEWPMYMYVESKLKEDLRWLKAKAGRTLLDYALFPERERFRGLSRPPNIMMMEILLRHGANPNNPFEQRC